MITKIEKIIVIFDKLFVKKSKSKIIYFKNPKDETSPILIACVIDQLDNYLKKSKNKDKNFKRTNILKLNVIPKLKTIQRL